MSSVENNGMVYNGDPLLYGALRRDGGRSFKGLEQDGARSERSHVVSDALCAMTCAFPYHRMAIMAGIGSETPIATHQQQHSTAPSVEVHGYYCLMRPR